MIADLISTADARWRRFLERAPHDFYHLPEYVELAARYEGGAPVAFYAEAGETTMLAPLLIRDLPAHLHAPPEWLDAVAPYGYPGPLASGPADAPALARCLDALGEVCRSHQIVAAFLRLHPLLPLDVGALAPFGEVHHHGQVVYVDLTLSPDTIRAQMRRDHRSGIRKLRALGFEARVDDWSFYPQFGSLYRETMARVRAAGFYLFSDAYLDDLRRVLGDRLHLCVVLSPSGELASAGLFCVTGGLVQYHLSGTATAHMRDAPSKLVFDTIREWSQAHGCATLHTGGGLGGAEDSLFYFKSGFSPLRADFRTFRMVFDAGRYGALSARVPNAASIAPGFFPVYRCRNGGAA